ncbi:MAG: DNA gyrase subunit A, partial [Gammaproteobacteria bacterium]|nr:DNA gyrase subunit A [Gammaproteobacteria bacterium]
RNGATVAALQVQGEDEIMMISSGGTLVRTGVAEISIVGRNTQGVRLIRLEEGERLVSVEGIAAIADSASADSAAAESGAATVGDANAETAAPPAASPEGGGTGPANLH